MGRKRLTLKQHKFVIEYVKDGNASRSAKIAYPEARRSYRVIGWENLQKPYIREAIAETLVDSGLNLEDIVSKLKEIMESDDLTEALKSIRLVLEMMGLIGKRRNVLVQDYNPPIPDDELERLRKELKERRRKRQEKLANDRACGQSLNDEK